MKFHTDLPLSAQYGYLFGRSTAYRDEYMLKARRRDCMCSWYVARARYWNHSALHHLKSARATP
jgi:hypothetical protein